MWLKLLLLTCYILLLFILSRVLEALSWAEAGGAGRWSHQLLDPMALSVAKLKALLEQRGVSYDHVVEKSELTTLVETSGHVTKAEVESPTQYETKEQTNFTCGAHFIEQVEDTKDSVWLVQVVQHAHQTHIVGDKRWRTITHRVSKFGVHTGLLDCSLDPRYCAHKNWRSPFLLLALPSEFQKKASIAMHHYSGPVKEAVVMRWLKDRLTKKLEYISDPSAFETGHQSFTKMFLEPEIHAVLFTQSSQPPLFFSALSVRFPGRVRFSVVNTGSNDKRYKSSSHVSEAFNLPSYAIYTAEGKYLYGQHIGEFYSFNSMERFFRSLYPCLNDIFIVSFVLANTMAGLEPLISNCRIFARVKKLILSVFKYNVLVIMLWLPIIGIFQMPCLDQVPLVLLKWQRLFSTSYIGLILRSDYAFYIDHPLYIYISMAIYLISVTLLCKRYRDFENDESWFSFNNIPPISFGANNSIGPSISGYDFFQSLRAQLASPSYLFHPTISSDYIQNLPTWCYEPLVMPEFTEADNTIMKSNVISTSDVQESSCDCDKLPSSMFHHQKDAASSNACLEKLLTHCINCSQNQNVSHSPPGLRKRNCADSKLPSPQTATPPGSSCTNKSNIQTSCEFPKSEELSNPSPILPIKESCTSCNTHTSKNYGRNLPENLATHVPHSPNTNLNSCSPGISYTTNSSSNDKQNDNGACSSDTICGTNYTSTDDITASPGTTNSAFSTDTSNITSTVNETDVKSYAKGTHSTSPVPTNEPESDSAASSPPNRLPNFPPGFVASQQCVICLEDYLPLERLCGLPCGHVFHETCVFTWLNRDKHFCPMCRWPSYMAKPAESALMESS